MKVCKKVRMVLIVILAISGLVLLTEAYGPVSPPGDHPVGAPSYHDSCPPYQPTQQNFQGNPVFVPRDPRMQPVITDPMHQGNSPMGPLKGPNQNCYDMRQPAFPRNPAPGYGNPAFR